MMWAGVVVAESVSDGEEEGDGDAEVEEEEGWMWSSVGSVQSKEAEYTGVEFFWNRSRLRLTLYSIPGSTPGRSVRIAGRRQRAAAVRPARAVPAPISRIGIPFVNNSLTSKLDDPSIGFVVAIFVHSASFHRCKVSASTTAAPHVMRPRFSAAMPASSLTWMSIVFPSELDFIWNVRFPRFREDIFCI